MDLCSIRGVTVDHRPIEALTWCKITSLSKILLGTVPVFVEENVPATEGVQDERPFLVNEDSKDFIDCSLEETQLLPTTKRATGTTSRLLSGSQTVINSLKPQTGRISSSFYVPATQQLEDSAISAVANESLPPVKSCDISVSSTSAKPVPAADEDVLKKAKDELDDDDEFFIIPETQQPVEDERPSPTIDRIPPVVIRPDRAERTQAEEDYFQMTAQDDDNSNDGLFNNEYMAESQNLLQNMDESYRRVDAAGSRKSILPERSVDSISFQEHRNATQDMSRLEWNETRPEPEAESVAEKKLYAAEQVEKPVKEDDRSITPELHFDAVVAVEARDRAGSVTPEVDFDQVPEIKPPAGRSELEDDDDEHEISLNQEGCFPKPVERVAEENGNKKPAEDVYDMETQSLDFDCFKKPSTTKATNSLSKSKDRSKENGVSPYDMETQALAFDDDDHSDPYDLLTQPMEPPKWSVFKKPPKPSASLVEPKGPEPEDFETQPMIPPAPLRRVFSKEKSTEPRPSTSSARTTVLLNPADIETQPMSPPERFKKNTGPPSPSIDPADLLTQPMSPPRNLREDSCSPVLKKPASKLFDAYELETQPLGRSFPPERKEDIDPYAMQTQRMQQEDDHMVSSYDLLTQPLQRSAQGSSSFRKTDTVGPATAHEISHFEPIINSTVRHSLLQAGTQMKDTKQDLKGEQISPSSSNKENQTRHGAVVSSSEEEFDEEEDEDLDDDVCLAATLPVGELDKESKKRGRGRPRKIPSPVFKVPSETALTTPKPLPTKSRRQSIVVTEFLTPEHPLLSLPKPDSILMASVHMRELSASHSREAAAQGGPKYHFKDDSSDDEDEDRLVFKKTHVSVALERELEKVKEVSKQKQLEKKEKAGGKKRGVKKEDQHDEDEEEGPKKRRVTVEKASSSTASGTGHNAEQQTRAKEPGKKSAREKSVKKEELGEKESSRGKDGKRKEKATSSSSSLPNKEEPHPMVASERVSTRSHREPLPKRTIDESVAYESSTSKGTAATMRTSTRTRKPREVPSPERRQQNQPEEKSEADGAAVPRRESKRQKTTNHKYRSHSPDPVKKKAITKKVDDPSSSTVSGLLRGGLGGLPSEKRNDAVVDISVTSSTGSEGSIRMARANRPKLIFTRMSPEPYRKCIARAGGKVVDIPELANVLVTDRIFRTYKFLCAVAKGIPIVGQSYLDALQAAQEHDEPVDPWEHILCDEISEKRYKFRLRDSLLKARGNKLFQDYTVFVTSNTQPPPLELYLILSCAGATPMKHLSQPVKQSGKMFIISDPADAASWPKYREKYPNIDVVSTEGFMLSIMQHSISLKKHRLM
ncbi:mediator of DNA damage checkpoint protein 1-like [Anopheles ziemanni]|uniref:mediator of DNA damage checkpoint protein 1-like n=1 Tax=Anopheles ziemanni TaxID=345580 RepID=UPI00265FB8E0|nr:mediator of DNA damage checkpoint protein 1-like [Anopheles ziemanni]